MSAAQRRYSVPTSGPIGELKMRGLNLKWCGFYSLFILTACGGKDGKDASCSVEAADGTSTITCSDGTSATVEDGAQGATGEAGAGPAGPPGEIGPAGP